ncbi:nucleotide exchange factor GrpE [Amycolatopsis sp.]|uniref:nucleotide exchange factor GrpE n=1 Tax=Amycolatopsis sp. TaxID=37632 RepID=UPI0039C89FFF
MRAVPSWFRRDPGPGSEDPTGQIPAQSMAKIIEEADGTAAADGASNTDVNSVMERALADRQALIQLCLYALDRARSGGVVERLEQGLAGIGVTAVRPDGQRFDPSLHEAGGAVVTDDPALDGVVAETEVVGFADHETLLRAPVVTVYTKR